MKRPGLLFKCSFEPAVEEVACEDADLSERVI